MDKKSAGFEGWVAERRNEVKQKTTASDFQIRKMAVQQIEELDAALTVWQEFQAAQSWAGAPLPTKRSVPLEMKPIRTQAAQGPAPYRAGIAVAAPTGTPKI